MTEESYELVTPGATPEELARLVERSLGFLRDLNGKDLERIGAWFGDESELWIPPAQPRRGRSRIVRLLRIIFSQYQELHWRARRLYPVNATTMITEVETWGRFADGRAYGNAILTVQRFDADGRLVVLSDYFKATDVFAAGATPAKPFVPRQGPAHE